MSLFANYMGMIPAVLLVLVLLLGILFLIRRLR